jgi:hypothetical protein
MAHDDNCVFASRENTAKVVGCDHCVGCGESIGTSELCPTVEENGSPAQERCQLRHRLRIIPCSEEKESLRRFKPLIEDRVV